MEEILFSKYHVQKVLKKSAKTRVLLASGEDGYCVIKEILKDEEGMESLLWETSILQTLDFPGIPCLYEIQETDKYVYLVEEYIEGATLQELVARHGSLNLTDVIYYGRKLAEIVNYLHQKKPNAILHLDIQPKNIIISDRQLYLIDYGNAVYMGKFDEKLYLKGTLGYAAPEQYGSGVPDVRTDIYGIGACIMYMLTGQSAFETECDIPNGIRNLLKGCMAEKPKERFPDVNVLMEELCYLEMCQLPSVLNRKKQKGIKEGTGSHPRIISFVGAQPRIGTSVLAMGFAGYLKNIGQDVLYEENNLTEMVGKIARSETDVNYENGEFYYQGIPMRPYYPSKNVRIERRRKIIIRDEGTYVKGKDYATNMVVVAGIQSWEKVYTASVIQDLRSGMKKHMALWLWNFTGGNGEERYMADLGVAGIRIPYMNKENGVVFDKIFEKIYKCFVVGE